MDHKHLFLASISILLLQPFSASFAFTSSKVLSLEIPTSQQDSADAYWTPERMKNAKPMPLPQANPQSIHALPLSALKAINDSALGEGEDGQPPHPNIKAATQRLFIPRENQILQTVTHGKFPYFNRGSSNSQFSSSRLVPITADLIYPYSAIGKLFFTIPGSGDYVCSAAVIKPRIILTAGHCVHKGSGGASGFYTNWRFVPAFREGTAPLQSWKTSYVNTTVTWSTGGASVPNAADYAMLEVADQPVGSSNQKIGYVTGYLGYQTLALMPNHAHLLGYPCNLDNCQMMHQVAAQSSRAVSPNNVEYGSDMRGGSSGGPWVQNFGALAVGQTGGLNPGLNRVIGVTSYGYTSMDPKSQGASIFDSRFTDLLATVCGHQTGNC